MSSWFSIVSFAYDGAVGNYWIIWGRPIGQIRRTRRALIRHRMAHTCKSSSWEVGIGGSKVQNQASLNYMRIHLRKTSLFEHLWEGCKCQIQAFCCLEKRGRLISSHFPLPMDLNLIKSVSPAFAAAAIDLPISLLLHLVDTWKSLNSVIERTSRLEQQTFQRQITEGWPAYTLPCSCARTSRKRLSI